jgi:alkanesulfonate monooxygenase SsuD/methylene tetrahydromethanopterin reductase-like flavin-dependent oxidoreductase (luciferase family)
MRVARPQESGPDAAPNFHPGLRTNRASRLAFRHPGGPADWLEEACEVIRSLWTAQRTSFDGRHYQLTEAVTEPKPVQQPHGGRPDDDIDWLVTALAASQN